MSIHHRSQHQSSDDHVNKSHYLPLELIDECINQPIYILLRSNIEYYGILKGYDDYVNIVLDDVTEIVYNSSNDIQKDKLSSILLNNTQIVAMCPHKTLQQ